MGKGNKFIKSIGRAVGGGIRNMSSGASTNGSSSTYDDTATARSIMNKAGKVTRGLFSLTKGLFTGVLGSAFKTMGSGILKLLGKLILAGGIPFVAILGVCLLIVLFLGFEKGTFSSESRTITIKFGGYELKDMDADATTTDKLIALLEQYPNAFDEIADKVAFDKETFLRILKAEYICPNTHIRSEHTVKGEVYLLNSKGEKGELVKSDAIPVYVKSRDKDVTWQMIYSLLAAHYGVGEKVKLDEPISVEAVVVGKVASQLRNASITTSNPFTKNFYSVKDLEALPESDRVLMNFITEAYTDTEDIGSVRVQGTCPVTKLSTTLTYNGYYKYIYEKGTLKRLEFTRNHSVLLNAENAIKGTAFTALSDTYKKTLIWQMSYLPYVLEDAVSNLAKNLNTKIPEHKEKVEFWNDDEKTVSPEEIVDGTWCYPVPKNTPCTSEFGPRNTGIKGASTNHKGIDLAVVIGTDVRSYMAGTVTRCTYQSHMGKYITVDHGNGLSTRYQHLNKQLVKVGDTVEMGQVIAESGNTGIGSGPHLHFTVMENGVAVNPRKYIEADGWPHR